MENLVRHDGGHGAADLVVPPDIHVVRALGDDEEMMIEEIELYCYPQHHMANKRAPPLHLFPTHGGPKENVEEARGDRDLREVAERARLAEADEGGERPVEAVEFADEDVGRLRALKAPIIYAEATASFHNPHIHFHYCRLVWRDKLLSLYIFFPAAHIWFLLFWE